MVSSNEVIPVSDKMPLLPPTLTLNKGVSGGIYLNALNVVPSPPMAKTMSSSSFLRSSASTDRLSCIVKGCTAYMLGFRGATNLVILLAASSASLLFAFVIMAILLIASAIYHAIYVARSSYMHLAITY